MEEWFVFGTASSHDGVYKTEGITQGLKFRSWLDDNFVNLKKEAAKTPAIKASKI